MQTKKGQSIILDIGICFNLEKILKATSFNEDAYLYLSGSLNVDVSILVELQDSRRRIRARAK